MERRLLLPLLLLAGCSRPDPPATPLSRAVQFLMSQEQECLWKSQATAFGSGQALTPFVLYALSHLPAEELAPHRARIDRALDRLPIAGAEYPTYSLSLSILALQRLRPSKNLDSLKRELRSKQLTEALGWTEGDPEYGGWDHGLIPARKPQCQRPDLSVTALACEALGGDAKARRFAERCRAAGGGFFFTPSATWAHQNKAGPSAGYTPAAHDAWRILGKAEGAAGGALTPEWAEAMVYYRAFAEAKVAPRKAAADELLKRQAPDGSWRNSSALMKEDEPLIATGLALIALSLSR